MDTVSIYFFNFSALAPGLLRNYCVIVPSGDPSYRFETLDLAAHEPLCLKQMPLLQCLDVSSPAPGPARFVRSYECPIDLAVQVLATLAGQLLDLWAVLRWDAVDKPLLHDLVADLQRIGKRLEGRVLRDRP